MHWFWRTLLAVLAGCLCWVILWGTLARRIAPFIHRGLEPRFGFGPGFAQVLAVLALLLPSLLLAGLTSWFLKRHRFGLISRCRSCGCYLADDTTATCPECGAPTQGKPMPTYRPLIVRQAVCSLCSAKFDVPLEARDWARCSNCGALVPV